MGTELLGLKNSNSLEIEYTVSVEGKNAKYFKIRARISGIKTEFIQLRMTGNYGRVKRLEELIPRIVIFSRGKEITSIEKISEFLWNIPLGGYSEIEVDYEINSQFAYSNFNLVRLPYRDEHHLYFPSASALIFPAQSYLEENEIEIQGIKIKFLLPRGWKAATSWGIDDKVITVLPPSLDSLSTGLIGLGPYRTYSFKVQDMLVETAFLGSSQVPDEEFNTVITKALESGCRLFGFFPFSRFFFLIHFIFDRPGQGSGNFLGWSSCLNYSRRFNGSDWIDKKTHIFHEIFHLWNGTEGPPLSRAQNDYSLIWFSEGVTRFYQYKNIFNSGLVSEQQFLDFIAEEFESAYHNSYRDEDIYRISEKYYTDREAFELIYSKGCCLAFVLDLRMKTRSGGKKSFDEVMRVLLERNDYRESGLPFTRDDLEVVLLDVLGEKGFSEYQMLCGRKFVSLFKNILSESGFILTRKKGRRLYFGVLNFGPPKGPVQVLLVDRESPAYSAGLRAGDILLKIDGQEINSVGSIRRLLEGISEDQYVQLEIERKGKRLKIMTLWPSYACEFEIKRKEKGEGNK
jgi:predicted metalloprotease with PDZ domain